MNYSVWIVMIVVVALAFDLLNGLNDSADITATIISSRSLRARTALIIAAFAGFAGPFIFGVAVARTIGGGIAMHQYITIEALMAGLIGACIWSIVTLKYGIPSSSSHALIGGLIGAVIISSGFGALQLKSLLLIYLILFLSPIAGLFAGWLAIKLIRRLLKNATPRTNYFFKWGQIPTAIALSAGNGANDAQKTMGIITLALIITGYQQDFFVPVWVIIACAGTKFLGSLFGGWRTIKLIGTKFYKIKPLHSFTSQLASASVIITASLIGGPVSTTQVVSMSVIGAGAGERLSKVRWLVVREIFLSWILTIPVTAILSMLIYLLMQIFIS